MAKDDKEHQMLFDLRGKRRNVVKVVYATLAVLMGLSLFLVIGGFNIAELFSSNSGSGEAAEAYEDQIERIEVKLKKDPQDPDLLLSLTRANVNAGNANVTVEDNGQQSFNLQAINHYEQAYQTWSEYLKAADEPNASLAILMSPTLLQLAEFARNYPQAETRIKAAVDAQRIVAEQRPSVNAFTTLAYYTYFTGDFEAGEKARAKAKKLAGSKAEGEAIDQQLDEFKKRAESYLKEKKQVEQQIKASQAGGGAQAGGGGAAETPEAPENPLGGALGGGLGE
jgi:hypothetical protein